MHAIVIEFGAVTGRPPKLELLVLAVAVNLQVRQAQMSRAMLGFDHGRPQNHDRAISPVGQKQDCGRTAAAQSLVIVPQHKRLGNVIRSGAEKHFAVGRQAVQGLLDFRPAGTGAQLEDNRFGRGMGGQARRQHQQQQRNAGFESET